MTLSGVIRTVPRFRDVDCHDNRLPAAWIWSNNKSATPPALRYFSALTPTAPRQASNAPVLVMLSGSNDESVWNALFAHARMDVRMYMLVPEGWGTKGVPSELLQAPKVLIRRVKCVPASAIHAAHEARVWLGGPWILRLDEMQSAALRQSFLRQFWHEAFEEAWTGGKQLVWRVASERPFDIPEVSQQAPVRVAPDLRVDTPMHGALVHLTSEVPPDEQPRKLWLRAGKDHHDRLAQFVRNGTEVLWEERGLPEMIVRQNSGQVLVGGNKSRLRITLNAEQAVDAAKLLEAPAPWRFGVDVPIGHVALQLSSFWVTGENEARTLQSRQDISLPDVTASAIRSMPETDPQKFEPPQPLALSARYAWNVMPPKVPAEATEDPLLGLWRNIDQQWASRLERVEETLHLAAENQGRISKAFLRLASAVLGFGRTHQGLLDAVMRMKKEKPSAAGSSRTSELLTQLAQIEERARALQGDIDKAEADEREKIEEEKQRKVWQARVDQANADLPQRREESKLLEIQREKLEAELAGVKEARKSASEDEKRDLHAKELALSDQIKNAKKQLTRLREEIQALEETAAEKFAFRPSAEVMARSKQAAGRFVPTSAPARPSITVPDETLPEVGSLRILKNQRYLVIRTWEELAAGEKAAERLNAHLVIGEKP